MIVSTSAEGRPEPSAAGTRGGVPGGLRVWAGFVEPRSDRAGLDRSKCWRYVRCSSHLRKCNIMW